ncbi:TetR/AcrR family transcriptional regulator [Paracidovorax konjaci]|uniref:DNA-binding transcriptional regulator, AcrR family n=1 Tax=Paracidovorax konjaci TaxID=32040 RepID=A0A1I1XZS2_9BURK|nr:TetR/AcrR family transcriptional regulator [Paracidovorax konjaci]SFE12801.1 DNA-binding transcriptional regulator, AcrR family [Paracidovorax konjaci]
MRVRTQAKRDAIVEAAVALFEEAGYEAASMNELAKRVGGSKATLYGYFPSKEQLLVAVVEQVATGHLALAARRLEEAMAAGAELRGALTGFGDAALQVLANDRHAIAVYRMVLAEAGRSDIGRLFHEAGPRQGIDTLARLMRSEMEAGRVRPADPRLRATQFLSLLTAEIDARIYERDPVPMSPAQIHGTVERAVEFFMAGAVPHGDA